MDIDLLSSLQTSHAAQLLEAREKERCEAKRKVVEIEGYLDSTSGAHVPSGYLMALGLFFFRLYFRR